ncbi:hypothetical protein [Legionella cardiaca]|uniref:Uncharacterized protein n=1 Tax=Legionella cardiaca TaxID=1071983 RepID=A0ABY8AMQ1_9GAMM|nr:hypothetical protein [Legionella cardiaca]WED41974.1 hypothetical protein PXX05_08495 [Legionella cardiaca]
MSKSLEQFKKSYATLQQSNLNLVKKLASSYPSLVLQLHNGQYDFSQLPWINLDKKTLADFKALAIYFTMAKKLLPFLYPGVDFTTERNISIETLLTPKKLNPTHISQAVESTIELTDSLLHETRNTITGFESFLNFLKSCLNFLVTLITFGYKQNFFESTTFQLDQIKQIQEKMHTSFETLEEEEKVIELDSILAIH